MTKVIFEYEDLMGKKHKTFLNVIDVKRIIRCEIMQESGHKRNGGENGKGD